MVGRIELRKNEERRLKAGHLWIFSNEIKQIEVGEPGGLAQVFDARGKLLGTAYANPHSLISGRMLSRKALESIDAEWWQRRLGAALQLRQALFDAPHYRWVHGEGDRLPGLIVDRFGDDVVVQAHTAGIERQLESICAAITALVAPSNIYLQNDIRVRKLEGLENYTRVHSGDGSGKIVAVENGVAMHAHALEGQKTGYFFDQRPNRAWLAPLTKEKRVLDLFSYVGAFAAQALQAGATEVVSVDASQTALEYAERNMSELGAAERWQGICADVMKWIPEQVAQGERFDVVVCDPPAFVKSRKLLREGLAGYQKVNKLAARLVAPGGMLCSASCSGLVSSDDLRKSVGAGVREAGRSARMIYEGGAGMDHPWLPAMPETRYLKFFAMVLD
jgi:23S rRNA (cytosine1962-C5)-methyltransferase